MSNSIIVSAMAFDGGRSGISVYIRNVLQNMADYHELTVYALRQDIPFLPKSANIRYIPVSNRLARPLFNMLWHLLILPFLLLFRSGKAILLPAANRRALIFHPKPTVAVVHDLSQYHIPAKYDVFRMFYVMRLLPFCVRRAQHIVAVSSSTAEDLKRYWRIRPERLSVIHNGFDHQGFFAQTVQGGDITVEMGLPEDFILYISRIEHPGKNHLNLIRAYELLPLEIKSRHALVLVGNAWPGADIVLKRAKESPDSRNIIFTGFIDNSRLAGLYRHASLYVFPSHFEGFGLSLVEAMAAGVPAVCSNTPSLAEVGADAVLLFDPNSPEDIAKIMLQALCDSELRQRLTEAGLRRARDFDWIIHTQKLMELLNA